MIRFRPNASHRVNYDLVGSWWISVFSAMTGTVAIAAPAVAQADLLKLDTPLPSLSPVVQPSAAPSIVPPSTVPTTAPAAPPRPSPLPVTAPPASPTIDETYTLGAGDKLQINLFNVPELSGEFRVAADGQMNLPWIGTVNVDRLTLTETKQLLTQQYKPFLKRPPLVTLTLLETRPVRVVVAGEVNRPGTYQPTTDVGNVALPGQFAPTNSTQINRNALQWPTLTQALQTAGGITQQADIRRVTVRRPLRDNRVRVAQVDLWQLIRGGNSAQDITLRDGDVIVVPQAAELDPAMAYRLGTASFSPRNIRVQVVGEVTRPGAVEIPTNSSLNQAILAAGGFDNDRAKTTDVQMVRLNPDGTVDKRTIAVNFSSPPNADTNPVMRDNDVLVVQRTSTAKVTDRAKGIGGILSPFAGVFSLLRLIFD